MSSPSLPVPVVLPRQPSILTYGLVLFLLGLAVVFLINRVKIIDQRQRMLELQHQQQNDSLTEEVVQDLIYSTLSDETVMKKLLPKCSCSSCPCPAAATEEQKEEEPEIIVTAPPLPAQKPAPKPAKVEPEAPEL